MRQVESAKTVLRFSLLVMIVALVAGLGWLFWKDLGQGRTAREVDRIQDAQEQIGSVAPIPDPPAAAPN